MTSIKINHKKKYNNLVVTKPWGSEYIACENNTTATWLLKIKKNHRSEERRVGKEGRSRWSPYH